MVTAALAGTILIIVLVRTQEEVGRVDARAVVTPVKY